MEKLERKKWLEEQFGFPLESSEPVDTEDIEKEQTVTRSEGIETCSFGRSSMRDPV